MSVQCGSTNCSTTTLPRKAASGSVRPCWSVRVKPGACFAGTGESDMRLARCAEMPDGMPDGRRAWPDAGERPGRKIRYADPATAATSTTVTAAANTAVRSRPPPGACWPRARGPDAAPGEASAVLPGLPARAGPGAVCLHLIPYQAKATQADLGAPGGGVAGVAWSDEVGLGHRPGNGELAAGHVDVIRAAERPCSARRSCSSPSCAPVCRRTHQQPDRAPAHRHHHGGTAPAQPPACLAPETAARGRRSCYPGPPAARSLLRAPARLRVRRSHEETPEYASPAAR